MINLQMFTTEEDLMKLTGLSRDELWENDFDLDDLLEPDYHIREDDYDVATNT